MYALGVSHDGGERACQISSQSRLGARLCWPLWSMQELNALGGNPAIATRTIALVANYMPSTDCAMGEDQFHEKISASAIAITGRCLYSAHVRDYCRSMSMSTSDLSVRVCNFHWQLPSSRLRPFTIAELDRAPRSCMNDGTSEHGRAARLFAREADKDC
ncbi:hypothetical protein MRB53_040241 [Persea americana]|nr:hypothetical protein MRB53_040241 [Persea americana]